MKRLAIFDIDDTLFDWLGMWNSSFENLLSKLACASNGDLTAIKAAFRKLHRSVGTSEHAYTPSDLARLFPQLETPLLGRIAAEVAHDRVAQHVLFPGIEDTLGRLATLGVEIVLHTDAPPHIASERVASLRLARMTTAVYCTAVDGGDQHYGVQAVEYRKPDPSALRHILRQHGARPESAIYVGDSLYKDIAMAQDCGVLDVYAYYGCNRAGTEYQLLRDVSHWTDADIARERTLLERGEVVATHVASEPLDLARLLTAWATR